ncbi:hypothetical protein [Cryobacterium frigoriphilum]|uniref:hypothetical protein n=1 Tax=Cryobacterium frigoriphilum TaxID=1259150 RepID=UPI00106C0E87|nr:hypothetical protein [Cryobacterium frigoriphilum]
MRRSGVFTLALLAVPLAFCTSTAAFGVASVPTSPKSAVTASVPPGISHSASLFEAALIDYTTERASAESAIEAETSVVANAQTALDASAGKTLTEDSRAVLAPALDLARLHLGFATAEMTAATADADFTVPVDGLFTDRPNVGESTATLDRLTFSWADKLASLDSGLPAAVQGVTDAVAAWNAEQARLAAIEAARLAAIEAARVAAEQAAAAAAARSVKAQSGWSGSSGSGASSSARTVTPRAAAAAPVAASPAPVRAVAMFNKNVWASGFQAEIDACRGAVNVTARYGVAVIAEHWSCGGSRFPGAGTTITLSGVNSGTYRVGGTVAVLNVATDGTSSIPRGYDLLYQTCINGSSATMAFVALTRVG